MLGLLLGSEYKIWGRRVELNAVPSSNDSMNTGVIKVGTNDSNVTVLSEESVLSLIRWTRQRLTESMIWSLNIKFDDKYAFKSSWVLRCLVQGTKCVYNEISQFRIVLSNFLHICQLLLLGFACFGPGNCRRYQLSLLFPYRNPFATFIPFDSLISLRKWTLK